MRIAQIADGIRTDTVQDVNLPLPQLLTAEQGGTTNRYLRGLGLIGEQQGNAWQYHLPDALGSVRQLTDPQGHVVLAQHFDPFGAPTIVNRKSEIVNRYGFAGEEQDAGGHVFLRARTYNPETGRFLQSDPVLGTPDQPRTLHHYAYAFNNPVNYTDPSGLMPPGSYNRSANGDGAAPPHNYRGQQVSAFNPFTRGSGSRSANSGGIPIVRASIPNNYTRAQSQGHRPRTCGISDIVMGLGKAALNGNLVQEAFGLAIQLPEIFEPVMSLSDADWLRITSFLPQLGRGGLLPPGSKLGDSFLDTWINGQIDQIKTAWEQRDWRMAASIGYGVVMAGAVGTLAASGVGLPLAALAGVGAVAANTMFNAMLYDDWANFGANMAGGGIEMGFGMAGGAIGGPVGWLIGAVIGAGVGQITTNVMSGQRWDDFLLGSMLFSGAAEGIGGAVGHMLGGRLRNEVGNVPDGQGSFVDGMPEFRRGLLDASESSSSRTGQTSLRSNSTLIYEKSNPQVLRDVIVRRLKKSTLTEDLAVRIEQGDVAFHINTLKQLQKLTTDIDSNTNGLANVLTNDIYINLSAREINNFTDILLTIVHEGAHLDDIDNVTAFSRELFAYTQQAKFGDELGLKDWTVDAWREGRQAPGGPQAMLIQRMQERRRIPLGKTPRYKAFKRKMMVQYPGITERKIDLLYKERYRRYFNKYGVFEAHTSIKSWNSLHIEVYGKPIYDNPDFIKKVLHNPDDPLQFEIYLEYIERLRRENRLQSEFDNS